jgi:hypothetical protein
MSTTEPDQDVTPALGAALAEPADPLILSPEEWVLVLRVAHLLGLDPARSGSPHEVLQQCLKVIAEHENAITWDTTCLACATMLDRAYAETCRAERAEAKLAAIVAHCRAKADEFNATMPLRVRPEDIKVMGGDIIAIINREGG